MMKLEVYITFSIEFRLTEDLVECVNFGEKTLVVFESFR